MKRTNKIAGFTLIEIMVVVTISMIIVGFGIARYSKFLEKQGTIRAAEILATELRGVQKLSDSGQKYRCVIGGTMDGSLLNQAELAGYEIAYDSALNALSVTEICNDGPMTRKEIAKWIQLKNDTTLANNVGTIIFPVLSGNLSTSKTLTVTNKAGTCTIELVIDDGGDISIDSATISC